MNKLILLLFSTILISSSFAGEILRVIESKRTGDQIISECHEIVKNQCRHLEIKFYNNKLRSEVTLKEYKYENDDLRSLPSLKLKEVEIKKKIDLMKNYSKEFFSLVNGVCKLGKEKYGSNKNCLLETGMIYGFSGGASAMLTAGGVVAGFPMLPVLVGVSVFGGLKTGDILWGVKPLLLPVAFTADLLKGITIRPVKKIILKMRAKHYKKKIYPLLESLGSTEVALEDDKIRVRHGIFKKVKRIFNEK